MAGNDFYSLYTGHDFNQDIQNAQIQPMQFELQKMGLQEQLQEAKQQAQPQGGQPQGGLAGMAGGAPTQQSALAQGAKSIFGNADVKLTDANGNQTMAGKINDEYQQASKDNLIAQGLDNDSIKIKKMATFETDPSKRAEMMNKASEVAFKAQQIREKNQKLQDDYKKEWQDVQAQGLLNMANAKTQREVDQARKDYEDKTGTPVPAFIPDKLDPNGMRKALDNPNIPKAVGDAVRKDLREQQTAQDLHAERQRRLQKEQAADQNGTATLGGLTLGKEYKDVRGEVKGLTKYLDPSVIKDISGKEIPKVASTIESAKQTSELADLVEKHPDSAGLAASFVKGIDKFMPERYTTESEGGESVISRANAAIDEWTPPGNHSADEIAQARSIAKKAVDVINARALAASGGTRMLISEVNMQKGVIGLEGLSPKSAVKVYKDLSESDLNSLRKLGVERGQIKGFEKKSEEPKAATEKQAIPSRPTEVPANAQYSPSQKKWWWKKSDGTWESK